MYFACSKIDVSEVPVLVVLGTISATIAGLYVSVPFKDTKGCGK